MIITLRRSRYLAEFDCEAAELADLLFSLVAVKSVQHVDQSQDHPLVILIKSFIITYVIIFPIINVKREIITLQRTERLTGSSS